MATAWAMVTAGVLLLLAIATLSKLTDEHTESEETCLTWAAELKHDALVCWESEGQYAPIGEYLTRSEYQELYNEHREG